MKILVVDDDAGVRDVLLRALDVMGYEAIAARGGAEALGLCASRSFDLVITDLSMPGMDGLTLASLIKGESPATRVLLITAERKEDVTKQLEGSFVHSVLFKPFKLEEMHQEIQKILASRV